MEVESVVGILLPGPIFPGRFIGAWRARRSDRVAFMIFRVFKILTDCKRIENLARKFLRPPTKTLQYLVSGRAICHKG